MENIINDSRFAHIASDPQFKRVPRSARKVKIDKRFQSMFSDKKFKVKYTVDKRGRPVNQSSTENFRKYYELSSSDEEDSASSDSENTVNQKTASKTDNIGIKNKELLEVKNKLNNSWIITNVDDHNEKSKCKLKKSHNKFIVEKEQTFVDSDEEFKENIKGRAGLSSDESEGSDNDINEIQKARLTNDVKEKLRDMRVDYARGMGTLFSDDSSSDDDSTDDESEDEVIEHGWGELDRDAEEIDEATSRLAVLHMDWDRIRAVDIMVLCSSFLPSNGVIKSVTIYPSEYGLKRMKEEELKGPLELVESNQGKQDTDGEETKEDTKYHIEKLRQYQLNRLKYYYAVVECDSAETANKLYTECDGLEYESSATKLDVRFIPDDVTFEQEPKETCTSLPEPNKYVPRYFVNTALQQGKVDLTWDENDPNRVEFTKKLKSGVDNISDTDLQAFLASSSSEGEEGRESGENVENDLKADSDNETKVSDADRITRYRALLAGIEEAEEKKKHRDVEMEITWGVGLKEKAQKFVDEKLKAPQTPFEQMLEKRKQKKKLKKEQKQKEKKEEGSDSDGKESGLFSDDDIPSDIDMSDPYFKEEVKKLKPKKKHKDKETNKNEEEENRKKAELELLLVDNEQEEKKSHFNLKSIQEQENDSKKKKRRKQLKKKKLKDTSTNIEDDFQVDVKDERFSALYTSHHFNIDPADPQFKKTKGTEALMMEKLNRRKQDDMGQPAAKIQRMDPELSVLVKSVKNKTLNNHH